jgi:hypothetical protein
MNSIIVSKYRSTNALPWFRQYVEAVQITETNKRQVAIWAALKYGLNIDGVVYSGHPTEPCVTVARQGDFVTKVTTKDCTICLNGNEAQVWSSQSFLCTFDLVKDSATEVKFLTNAAIEITDSLTTQVKTIHQILHELAKAGSELEKRVEKLEKPVLEKDREIEELERKLRVSEAQRIEMITALRKLTWDC